MHPPPRPALAAASNQPGWLENLLVKLGVAPSEAHTVTGLVVRPFEILVIVLGAWLVALLGTRALRRALGGAAHRAAARSGDPRATGRASTVVALVVNCFRVFVVVVAIALVLGVLGVNLTPLLASATVIGAVLGFGAQSLVKDYLSGFLLTLEDQFTIGDVLTVNGVTGTVEDLSLRVTRLRGYDGTLYQVPNGEIRLLANTSRGWARAVVEVPVAVPGPEALDRLDGVVAAAARAVADDPELADVGPPEILGLVAVDGATCTLKVALRTTPSRRDAVARALRRALVQGLAGAELWPAPG
jgi:small conductance mechanosensitive channel